MDWLDRTQYDIVWVIISSILMIVSFILFIIKTTKVWYLENEISDLEGENYDLQRKIARIAYRREEAKRSSSSPTILYDDKGNQYFRCNTPDGFIYKLETECTLNELLIDVNDFVDFNDCVIL